MKSRWPFATTFKKAVAEGLAAAPATVFHLCLLGGLLPAQDIGASRASEMCRRSQPSAHTYTSAQVCLPLLPTGALGGEMGRVTVSVRQTPPFLLTLLSPQSALLPAGFRQKDQTQKAATGPFDREHLLMYLEKEALEQKDREDFVPFTGEKKGKDLRVLGLSAPHVLS